MAGRLTQAVVEVVVLPTSQSARATQTAIEVVVLPTSQLARITQVAYEILIGAISGESFGWARAWLSLQIIANGVMARSRRIEFAGGSARFVPTPSEVADVIVIFGFRGKEIGGGRVTWQMVNPPVPPGSFEIVSDDEEVLLVFPREQIDGPPEILFTGSAVAIEVHMIGISNRQLDDLRAWLRLPPAGHPY